MSRNITPRANGLPASRTLDEFKQLVREGDFGASQETPILPVMPWTVYGKRSDRELEAIYEYLRAIPSIPNPRPEDAWRPRSRQHDRSVVTRRSQRVQLARMMKGPVCRAFFISEAAAVARRLPR